MEKTRNFLNANMGSFERYSGFKDHEIYYVLIEQKQTTDSVIETCKALIEGICKTILNQVNLQRSDVRKRFLPRDLKSLESTFSKMEGSTGEDFAALYRQAVLVLSIYSHSCEKDLLSKLGNEFCKYIGRVRNADGPIAHGQPSPKPNTNTKTLANMVESITDIICLHMLEVFSLIDFVREDIPSEGQAIKESFMLKTDDELNSISKYEKIVREFNESLDELYPLDGKPIYSRALYDQYQEDYEIQLQEFIDNKEQELME
jgi:hypothetical protein